MYFVFYSYRAHRALHSFPTRRSSDLIIQSRSPCPNATSAPAPVALARRASRAWANTSLPWRERTLSYGSKPCRSRLAGSRSEEHTSELQSRQYLVCRLLLEKKKHTG